MKLKYMMMTLLISGVGALNAKVENTQKEQSGTASILDELDPYTQSPQEAMMKEMAERLQQSVNKIFDAEQLALRFDDKEKELFAGLMEHEHMLEQLQQHPDFKTQKHVFDELQKKYEKKGMSEEVFAEFLQKAEVECPLALQYMNFSAFLDQFKSALGDLFKEAFFDSLRKMKLSPLKAQ